MAAIKLDDIIISTHGHLFAQIILVATIPWLGVPTRFENDLSISIKDFHITIWIKMKARNHPSGVITHSARSKDIRYMKATDDAYFR